MTYLYSKKGFTLVELLVSLAIASIVMAAAYSMYIMFYKQTSSQNLLVEAQQNSRAGLELLQKELVLVGYRVPSGVAPIVTAQPNSITFRYVDPVQGSTTFNQNLQVTYDVALISGVYSLRKQTCVQDATWTADCSTVSFVRVVDNLTNATGLAFTYYDIGGIVTGDPANIRFVKVSLTTVTSTPLPSSGETKTAEVHTEVRLRNLGILSAAANTTPPNQPAGLEVREVTIGARDGICGRLRLKWVKGTDEDLAGYRIFYSIGSGAALVQWNYDVALGNLESDATHYFFTLAPTAAIGSGGLDFCRSDGSTVSTYSFNIRAYDNANNFSTASDPPVSGNPTPSSYSFGAGGDDTTINPSKPLPTFTNFRGQDGAAGQVKLTWTYDTANNPDVKGFRIYRSSQPFTTFPIVAAGDVTQVTGAPDDGFPAANTLNQSAASFTDSGLIGCQVYYYAIAAVTCDPTLITDSGSDPVTARYIQSDYAFTNGDGGTDTTQTSGIAGVADTPAGSDTSPVDGIAPGFPSINTRAGWRRVAITVTNPADDDFAQTCLYVQKGGSDGDPPLDNSKDVNGCFNVIGLDPNTRGLVPDASPDSNPNGIFKNTSPITFWHDSMTERVPAEPDLAQAGSEVQTYAYKAVTFDKCGNPESLTSATATTTVATTNLCGEDPPSGEKPPAPGLPAAPMNGCEAPSSISGAPLTITWTPVSSDVNAPSSITNPWDLAGYRIFRSAAADFSDPTLMNPSAPYWCEGTCTYLDNSVSEGTAYYYRITSTDCPYEKVNPSVATITNDMEGNYIHSTSIIGPFAPGRISRDEKCPGGSSCVQDLHREVLTGISIAADNSSTPASNFMHNTVTMFIENTSAGEMTIQKVTASWIKNTASLTKVTVGGGRSGLPLRISDISRTLSQDITGADPYTRVLNDLTLSNAATIPGLLRYVPITFEFTDRSDGTPVDMRADQLLMTLSVKNESTGTTSCVSYPTVSGTEQGIVVPRGPAVSSVQQTNPVSNAYAVPGADGANILPVTGGTTYGPVAATAGQDVTITVYAVRDSDAPINSVKLYWARTALTDGDARDGSPSAASFSANAITMTNMGSNLWSGIIPASAIPSYPARIWYYVIVTDDDGNYDRAPEINEGYYSYDWKAFDPCDVTPNAPVVKVWPGWSSNTTYAAIMWNRVETYTNGLSINPAVDPLKYEVWRRNSTTGSFVKLYDVLGNHVEGCVWSFRGDVDGAGPATSSYDAYCTSTNSYYWEDYIDTISNHLTYYVVAKNSCPNRSVNSNTWTECVGSLNSSISTTPSSITNGSSYTASVSDCQLATNALVDSITINNISSNGGIAYSVTLTETNASSGQFTGNIATTWNIGEAATKVYARAGDTSQDTITVSCTAGCSGTPVPATVIVNAGSCENNPERPTGLAGVVGPSTGPASERNRYVDLSWTASTSPDRVMYRVYRRIGAGGTFEAVGDVVSSASGTITFRHEPGQTELATKDYYYYVVTIDSCSTPKQSVPSTIIGPF